MTCEAHPPTNRLYLVDSRLLAFRARVLATEILADGRIRTALDQSAFFPVSGGQASDTGHLAGRRVDALEEEGGIIWHLLLPGSPLDRGPAVGEIVDGQIDAGHRFDMIQQHTGQHILSRCLIRAGCSPTRSVHFGQEDCTVDLDGGKPTREELDAAQEEADRCILENRPIRVLEAGREDMDRLGIRWDPGSERERYRVVDIEGFDMSACGGTHARSTGEVGPILILGCESVRGRWRVHFVSGNRALRLMRQGVRILDDLAKEFTVSWKDLPAAVMACRGEARRAAREERRLLRERGEWLGGQLFEKARKDADGIRRIGAWLGQVSSEEIRAAGRRIGELGPAAFILGGDQGGKASWLAGCSASGAGDTPADRASPPWDAGSALRSWLHRIGGKGGGTATTAQGASRLPDGEEEARAWDLALRQFALEGMRDDPEDGGRP